jgi:hypothetical protein
MMKLKIQLLVVASQDLVLVLYHTNRKHLPSAMPLLRPRRGNISASNISS